MRLDPLINYWVASTIHSHPNITTCCLPVIDAIGQVLGEVTSICTRGNVQLNTCFPRSVRGFLRGFGRTVVGPFNRAGVNLISRVLPNRGYFIQAVVIGPIFEELVFRAPLLLASSLGVGNVTMVALVAFSSIVFIYGHDDEPEAGRAAGCVIGGLTLSHLTLHPDAGLGNAIIAHIIHNFVHSIRG